MTVYFPSQPSLQDLLVGAMQELTLNDFSLDSFCKKIGDPKANLFDISLLVIDNSPFFLFLTGEEFLASLIYLYITVSSRYSEEEAVSILITALCMVAYDFFATERDNSYNDIFVSPSWIGKIQALVKEATSNDKLSENCLSLIRKELIQERGLRHFSVDENSSDPLHPSRITPTNRLHDWHALCYWLSQFMEVNDKALEIALKSFCGFKAEGSVVDNLYMGAGLTYFFQLFQKQSDFEFDMTVMQIMDIDEWMKYPRSYWFLSLLYSSTPHRHERWLTKKLIDVMTCFLIDSPHSKANCLSEVLLGFSYLGKDDCIDLDDLSRLLEALARLVEGDFLPDTDLARLVSQLFDEIFKLEWECDDIFKKFMFSRKPLLQISEGILGFIEEISKSISREAKQNLVRAKEQLILIYLAAISLLFDQQRKKISSNLGRGILMRESFKPSIARIFQEAVRIFDGMEISKERSQIEAKIKKVGALALEIKSFNS